MRGVMLACACALVACGGSGTTSAPPSVTAPTAVAGEGAAKRDAGAESFGEVNPADLAELQGGAPKADPPKSASAAPATDPGPIDDCSPVARELERRARPKIKECYREGKKKEPDLKGTIKIGFEIDGLGKAKPPKIVETTLPKDVSACMLKAMKETPMTDAAKCPNKNVMIPVTFPTPP